MNDRVVMRGKRVKKYIDNNKKFLGKFILLIFVLLLCLKIPVNYAEEKLDKKSFDGEILIFMDGEKVNTKNVKPFIHNGRTMVPIRLISETLGANVRWVSDEKVIIITKDEKLLYIPIGSNQYIDNGMDISMDTKAMIVNSRTYVPIKFISEALNTDVEWLSGRKEHHEKGMVFLFSKDQTRIEKEAIEKRAIREYDFSKKTIALDEVKAINFLNSIDIDNNHVFAIATANDKSYAVTYEVEQLINESAEFLYYCTNKTGYELDFYIKEKSDRNSKEELFTNYNNKIERFLFNEKFVFKNFRKVVAGKESFKVYLSAIDMEAKDTYLVCFYYTTSKKSYNKIKIDGIEIRNINNIELNSPLSLGDLSSYESNKEEMAYELIPFDKKRLWTVNDSDRLTRTSFYIQKLKNGKYEDEILSLYIADDDWTKSETKKKYKDISKELALKILENTRLSEEELSDYMNSGFRINAYAEIKAIDPSDNVAKWYRFAKNGGDYTSYKKIFTDKDKANFYKLSKMVIDNFPSHNLAAYKSFEFKGDVDPKKMITVKFLDKDTKEEIKSRENLIEYTSDKSFTYKAPKQIGKFYDLIGDEEISVAFDADQKDENKELILLYQSRDVDKNNVDFVLDEWRLSKQFDSLVKDKKHKDASLKFLIPRNKGDHSLKMSGFVTPISDVKFNVLAKKESDFIRIDYKKECTLPYYMRYDNIYQPCDAPILIKRQEKTSLQDLPYNQAIGNVEFTVDTDEQYFYNPVKLESNYTFLDDSKLYNIVLDKKIPLNYTRENAIYNIGAMFLNHQSPIRLSPSFQNSNFYNELSGEFGSNIRSNQSLTILPRVMMIYDDEVDGKTKAKFVKANHFRTIMPLSNHRVNFSTPDNVRIDTNVNSQRKAKSLAKAMGKAQIPVVDKGADVHINYSGKNMMTISSYSLDIAGKDYSGETAYNYNALANHEIYLQELGLKDNKIRAKIKMYMPHSSSSNMQDISLHRNGNEKVITHRLEVRSGRVIAVDGIPYSNLSYRLKTALDNMKLSSKQANNNVLGAFSRNEGQIVEEEVFSDLSLENRHILHERGTGWYNEDSLDLVLIEKQSNFDLESVDLRIKAPFNIKGLETPINDRLKYSRGKEMDINMEFFLESKPDYKIRKSLKSAFILPNSEK